MKAIQVQLGVCVCVRVHTHRKTSRGINTKMLTVSNSGQINGFRWIITLVSLLKFILFYIGTIWQLVWHVAHTQMCEQMDGHECILYISILPFTADLKNKALNSIINRSHLIEKSNEILTRTSAFTLEVPEIVYKYIPQQLAFQELRSLDRKAIWRGSQCVGFFTCCLSAPMTLFNPPLRDAGAGTPQTAFPRPL